MAYTKTTWVDHITDGQGAVLQQGTPVDAARLNHIEDGLAAADAAGAQALSKLSALSQMTELQGGTGLDFYYNDAIVVLRINTVATPANDDTTTLKLPSGARFNVSMFLCLFAMSTSWQPTGNNVILTTAYNTDYFSIRYQTIPGSNVVLAATFTLPRAWFSISGN